VTVPPDDGLPQRLRAQQFIREGEQRVGRAWFRALTGWLDRVRPAVTRDGADAGRVSDFTGAWSDAVDVQVVPVVGGVLGDAWRRVTGRGEPQTDTWVSGYLNEVGNRLKNVPDEVYALIVREIERGIREGLSIPEVTAAVQTILTSTTTPYWPNRAVTVARTETIAAVNAGVFRAAELDAEERGDVAPAKVWIATDDTRTRPTHQAADKQRTLLRSPFVVGGARLLFPGDPTGPANEVINCRCSMLPVVLGEEIDWTDRQFRRTDDGT
jgi:hypothetical protein